MSPIGTVQVIYAAFARSDIPAVLAVVSPDVDGEYAGNRDDMPWLRRRLGHAGGAVFSRELPESLHIEHFTPTTFLEGPGGRPRGTSDLSSTATGNLWTSAE